MKRQAKQSKPSTAHSMPAPAPSEDIRERVRRRAYQLWEQSGFQHGQDLEHWLKAEQEILDEKSE